MEQTVSFGTGNKHFLNGFVETYRSLHGTLRSDCCWPGYALKDVRQCVYLMLRSSSHSAFKTKQNIKPCNTVGPFSLFVMFQK
jgi:hypothetical protein